MAPRNRRGAALSAAGGRSANPACRQRVRV